MRFRPKRERLLMSAPLVMFATGIENTYPTINNGRTRIDEMAKCGHCKHWRHDVSRR
jgi:beta-glucosidase